MEKKLPDGWKWIALKDLSLEFINGGTPSTKVDSYWQGTIPWITSASISSNSVTEGSEYISEDAIKNSSANVIPKGNLLFVTRVGIGKAAVNEIECSFSQDITGIILDRELVIPEYIARYIQSPTVASRLKSWARGATIKGLQRDQIEDLLVPTPSLETQRKIIAILDRAEETKQLRAQANVLTQKLLQSVFLEIFGDPAQNPLNWDLFPLEDVCTVIHRYPTFYGFKYVPAGVPVLKISNMDDEGGFYEDGFDRITEEINKAFPLTIVDAGDIIFEARGTYIGKCAVVPERLKGSNISPNTIRIGIDRSKILPEYLFALTLTKGWKSLIENKVNYWKGGFGTIKASDLKSLKIPLPPMDIQYGFLSAAKLLQKLKENSSNSTIQLNHYFQVLMSRAFTGELVA